MRGTAILTMTGESAPITATMEDYLEGIFLLSRDRRVVRMRDIAGMLGVTPSTATTTVQALAKRGLLFHEKYEDVVLTDKGRDIAEDVLRRHTEIRAFLEDILLLDHDVAEEEACRMEHGISEVTLDRLRWFAAALRNCGNAGAGCMRRFRLHVETGEPPAVPLPPTSRSERRGARGERADVEAGR
ncbi:MAG: metal-dependent transcriptional regulator [Armatimonadetes bacterium]|nr:metal-dependent transcriptional regulator [Armatimonadota bacterium]